jgi:hypothetical protein
MRTLWRAGKRPHPLGPRYAAPVVALYWASPREYFAAPGLYLAAFKRQVRIVPLPRMVGR